MTEDKNKGLTDVDYNYLNLPQKVIAGTDSILYIYDALGTKLAKKLHTASTEEVHYRGSFVYKGSSLDYLIHEEGLIDIEGSNATYQYYLKDHLGNIRVVFTNNEGVAQLEQEQHYYPFGMVIDGLKYNNSTPNKYLYNGKELQDDLVGSNKLDWLDYGARMYDTRIGRFHLVDNYAEKYVSLTPYHYTANNPLNFIDYNGEYILMYDKNGVAFWYENGKAYWVEKDEDGNVVKGKEYEDVANNSAIQQTVNDLSKIEETGYGNRMVDDLVDSEVKTTIEFNNSHFTPASYNNDDKSEIIYGTRDWKGDGVSLGTSHINLGHEIAHAWADQFAKDYAWFDVRTGAVISSSHSKPNTQKLKAESFAVRFENYLRAMNGESRMRVRYNGIRIFPFWRLYNDDYFRNNPLPKSYKHIKPKNGPINPLNFADPKLSNPRIGTEY